MYRNVLRANKQKGKSSLKKKQNKGRKVIFLQRNVKEMKKARCLFKGGSRISIAEVEVLWEVVQAFYKKIWRVKELYFKDSPNCPIYLRYLYRFSKILIDLCQLIFNLVFEMELACDPV